MCLAPRSRLRWISSTLDLMASSCSSKSVGSDSQVIVFHAQGRRSLLEILNEFLHVIDIVTQFLESLVINSICQSTLQAVRG